MEKVKKLGLVAVLVAVLLAAGCSGNSGNSANSPATTPGGGGGTTDQGKQPEQEAGAAKLFEQPLTLEVMIPDTEPPVLADSPVIREIFNRTNVRVALQLGIVGSNYEPKVQTLTATNNLPDIIRMPYGAPYFNDSAKNGLFVPISDYLEHAPNFSAILAENNEINKTRVDGKLYGFPVLGNWRLQLSQTAVIRQDVLDELNLDNPETFDDLYTVFKAFKQAYPDLIPFTNRNGASGVMKSLSFAMGSGYGIYYDPDVSGGSYVYGQAHEAFAKPLAFVHRLYAEKLLDPDYAVNTADAWREKLGSGKALFFYDNNTFAENFNGILQSVNPQAQFEVLPLMKNDSGQKRNYMFKKDWLHQVSISSKVKNPQDIVKFLDWMYSPEGTLLTNYGIEGEHYTMVDGQPTYLESVIDSFKETKDPHLYMETTLGIGLSNFTLNVDEHALAAVSSPNLTRWSEMLTTENGYVYEVNDPAFTADEVARLKTLRSKVDTLVTSEIDKFIMGVRPMSEFDSFSRELRDNGALEIEEIYNTALERFKTAKY